MWPVEEENITVYKLNSKNFAVHEAIGEFYKMPTNVSNTASRDTRGPHHIMDRRASLINIIVSSQGRSYLNNQDKVC